MFREELLAVLIVNSVLNSKTYDEYEKFHSKLDWGSVNAVVLLVILPTTNFIYINILQRLVVVSEF